MQTYENEFFRLRYRKYNDWKTENKRKREILNVVEEAIEEGMTITELCKENNSISSSYRGALKIRTESEKQRTMAKAKKRKRLTDEEEIELRRIEMILLVKANEGWRLNDILKEKIIKGSEYRFLCVNLPIARREILAKKLKRNE